MKFSKSQNSGKLFAILVDTETFNFLRIAISKLQKFDLDTLRTILLPNLCIQGGKSGMEALMEQYKIDIFVEETNNSTIYKLFQQFINEPAENSEIKEDGTEISRSRHRHVIVPFVSTYNSDTKKWTHTETDISKESVKVQAIANAAWTDDVKTSYKTFREAQNL